MSNALHEIGDAELERRFKEGTEHKFWTPDDCKQEIDRRAQLKAAQAMNRWTAVITVATIVNVGAAIVQAVAATGYFQQ